VTGGDLELVREDSGGLSLFDPLGHAVAAVGAASMWDSADPLAGAAGGGTPASRRAEAAIGVGRHELTVSPDATLFSDPRVVWPVYIDPPFNRQRSKWAYANSQNVNIISPVTAWVGRDPSDGKRFRSFFEFDVTALRGTQILAAEVTMVLDHSWSCTNTPVYLFGTGNITVSSGTRMSWSTRPLPTSRYLDSWSGHANEAGGCGVIEPDAPAVFDAAAVKNDVQAQATANASTYTVGLCACDSSGANETVQSRWKYFHNGQTYLVATYDLPPNAPTAEPFSATTDCYTACTMPATVRTTQPTLKVRVSDTYGGVLRTNFEVRATASGTGTLIANTTSPISTSTSGGPPPFGFASFQVPSGKLVNGTTYYWRAQSTDENNLVGPWLAFQTITVDTSAPATPTVTSSQYPALQWGAQVGTPGSFVFSGAADVADFTWWVDASASTTVPATGTNPRTATVTYTPSTDMVHTMHVRAKDTAGNISTTKDHQFWVSPLPNRCWHWKLNEASGTTAADTGNSDPNDPVCAPIGSTVVPMNATATANPSGSVAFAAGYLGNAAWFAGTGGQIATATAVLDTSKSFTVTAWVNPADLSLGDQAVVSQDGTTSSRFKLGFVASANAGAGGWCLVTYSSDGGATASACADGSIVGLPAEGTWVHLAGVFDSVTGQARMYVMGGLDSCGGETAVVASSGSWQATGKFVMGRAKSAGVGTEYWRGGLDGVHAYARALQEADICQLALQ
ncbi:MAG: LamG domain-containing protein, partial [Micromonosporaceae bacterium]